MKISDIKQEKNRVVITVKNESTNETKSFVLNKRFAIFDCDRWNFEINTITDYFIEKGKKGCFIGFFNDKQKYRHEIWDLSKIFENVQFEENDFSEYQII